MVLDGVICPSSKVLGDFSPLVAEIFMSQVQYPLFMETPPLLVNVGVEMIVPSLSALLSYPIR